jgi:hypothetical protein
VLPRAETEEVYDRSEGLGVASFRMVASGMFSARPAEPLRADAALLAAVTPQRLAAGFQAGAANPLVGIEGRAAVLNRQGATVAANPDVFAWVDDPRPGGLYDVLAAGAEGGRLPADAILDAARPSRADLARPHDARRRQARRYLASPADRRRTTRGLVPFKLTQWLALFAHRADGGGGLHHHRHRRADRLPEYRNGGLFTRPRVLRLKDESKRKNARTTWRRRWWWNGAPDRGPARRHRRAGAPGAQADGG